MHVCSKSAYAIIISAKEWSDFCWSPDAESTPCIFSNIVGRPTRNSWAPKLQLRLGVYSRLSAALLDITCCVSLGAFNVFFTEPAVLLSHWICLLLFFFYECAARLLGRLPCRLSAHSLSLVRNAFATRAFVIIRIRPDRRPLGTQFLLRSVSSRNFWRRVLQRTLRLIIELNSV